MSFLGFFNRMIKWILEVEPHLSGPNIIVYGVLSVNSASLCSAPIVNNLMYPPPHSCPSSYFTSYLNVNYQN